MYKRKPGKPQRINLRTRPKQLIIYDASRWRRDDADLPSAIEPGPGPKQDRSPAFFPRGEIVVRFTGIVTRPVDQNIPVRTVTG